jgi:tRNA A37 threonylcarbamoyladenosine biosynthesis protein TsaE
MTPELSKTQRIFRVGQVFRPAAPVDDLELFAGREQQRSEVVGAVAQIGYHVGLYGERGVGKTSLARVLASIFDDLNLDGFRSVMVNCYTESTFASLWADVFRRLEIDSGEFTPEGVRSALEALGGRVLVVVDELDRLEDDDALTLLADTIKTLSDHAVGATLILVGVATSLDGLIGEHASIVRNLAQIEMPRMRPDELRGILQKGCEHTGLSIETAAEDTIVRLSEGLPHYTHLLGYRSAERAVQDDRDVITLGDVSAAIPRAVEGHTIQNDYHRAIRSSQPGNLYREVLLACALAPKDQLGYFTSGQVREPLEVIAGRRLEIPAFAKHMNEFLSPERGSVIRREGKPRGYSYRFSDPMMQPYVVMSSLNTGLVTDVQLRALQERFASIPHASLPDNPGERGQLF